MVVSAKRNFGNGFKQGGQVFPVALFGILILSAMMLVMYNASQKITDKSVVANAADAAAYSGAVWTARHLNFMAYTNRAMIANHVAVGHFISYVSWFRYIDNVVDKLNDYTSWIPYWGTVISIIHQVIDAVGEVTEGFAEVAVPLSSGLNAVYRAAQAETKASLVAGGLKDLQDLMDKTAKTYDPSISINDNGLMSALPTALKAPLQVKVANQQIQLPQFVKQYDAGSDDGHISQLITQSYQSDADTRSWIAGNRGWKLKLTPLLELRKYGGTGMTQNSNDAEWDASDELQFCAKRLTWRGWRTKCTKVASGDATATEFDDSYTGVKSYYGLKGNPSDDHHLDIAAIAGKPQSSVVTKDLMGVVNNQNPMLVASLARVEFKRPVGFGFASLGGNRTEYANLFNPFWNAHLAAFSIPGF